MYERSYGSNYDGDRPVKEDAAIIRKTIKELVKAGELPAWKYSVRYRTGSMCRAIDVAVTAPEPTLLMAPDMVFGGPEGRTVEVAINGEIVNLSMRPNEVFEMRWKDVVKPETKRVHDILKALHDSYNHDGSDSMVDYFDVKFYGGIDIDTADGVDRFDRPAPARVAA